MKFARTFCCFATARRNWISGLLALLLLLAPSTGSSQAPDKDSSSPAEAVSNPLRSDANAPSRTRVRSTRGGVLRPTRSPTDQGPTSGPSKSKADVPREEAQREEKGTADGRSASGAAPARPIREEIAALYELTKIATTLEEFTSVIDRCHTLAERNATEVQRDYLQRLRSWAWNRRGEWYADQAADSAARGETTKADQLDQRALEDFEAAVDADASRWKAVHNRGVSYALQGKYQKAIDDFTQTIALQPSYGSAWFNRGEIRYELDQFAGAVEDYSKALEIDADDAPALISRGHAYFQLRQFERALQDYERAVGLLPEDAAVLANRGDAYRATSQWEKAASDYRVAIQMAPELGRAYQSAAWLMATCPNQRYRNEDLALQAAERAIELDGETDYRYLDTLAAAFANAGHFDRAQQAIEQAIELAPKSQVSLLQKRRVLYAEEQPYRQTLETTNRPDAARAATQGNPPGSSPSPAGKVRKR